MLRLMLVTLPMTMILALGAPIPSGAQEGTLPPGEPFFDPFKIKLRGMLEVPSISTEGKGKFSMEVVGDVEPEDIDLEDIEVLEYTLSYNFPSGTRVTQAHLHFGRKFTNGGIIASLCGTTGPEVCPEHEGSVSGILRSEDIIGPAAQGIAPGDFRKVLQAFDKGGGYVNVHTIGYPNGEIRGQLNDFGFVPIFADPFQSETGDGLPPPCDIELDVPCGPGTGPGFFPDIPEGEPLPLPVTPEGEPLPLPVTPEGEPLPLPVTPEGEPLPLPVTPEGEPLPFSVDSSPCGFLGIGCPDDGSDGTPLPSPDAVLPPPSP